MDTGNRRTVVAAMVANAGIAIAKFVGWGVTGASSMLAEGVHSLADSGNQALLLWGGASAAKKPTAEHPFGFGRERYFWAFIVSLIIFALGSVFAIYEGVHQFLNPGTIVSPLWAISILSLGLLLEGWSFHTAVTVARRVKGEQTWPQFVLRTKNPELPVVLLEDLGALIGLTLALVGVSVATLTGDSRYDAAATIFIGLLLGAIAVVLAIEMKSLIIGEAAESDDRAAIAEAIGSHSAVRRLISMRTQHLGPDDVLVCAKVDFDPELTLREVTEQIDSVETEVRAVVPTARLIYIEPDVYEADRESTP
ncbi:MAG: cation diffusion facilitator family transporter [Pseudohongiellaceae bacterium]|jgi:cation diffusion facilitator family transporter